MFTATIYKVMIGSLSGAMEEVHLAKEIIRKWNQDNAESEGKVFMPVEWSTKTEELNRTDIVIGLLGNWFDDISVVEECAKMGKKVILFFQTYHDPKVSIPGEVQEVEEFKNRIQLICSCHSYSNKVEIENMLNVRLSELY